MNPIKILNAFITVLFFVLVGVALVAALLLQAEQEAHLTTKQHHAQALAEAEAQRAIEEATRRKTEQELSDAQATHAEKSRALHLDLDRARAAARAADVGMRSATQTAAQRAREQCANPTAPNLGAPASDPIGLLADVLGRADARAQQLADIADQRGAAGSACEAAYDRAHQALKKLSTDP